MFFPLWDHFYSFTDYYASFSLETRGWKHGIFYKRRVAKGDDLITVRTSILSSLWYVKIFWYVCTFSFNKILQIWLTLRVCYIFQFNLKILFVTAHVLELCSASDLSTERCFRASVEVFIQYLCATPLSR